MFFLGKDYSRMNTLFCLILLFTAFLDRPSTILGIGLLCVEGLTVALSLAYLR